MKLIVEAQLSPSVIYERYYSDKIPPEIWSILMQGTDNMTIFHRKCADCIANYLKNPNYRLETNTFVKKLAEAASKVWSSSDYAKQFLVNTAKEDFVAYNDGDRLYFFLLHAINAKKFTENEFINDCLYKAYEDENLLVTVTLSYSASHKYYGDSHWCTASGIGGRYNGYEMFRNYTAPYSDKKYRKVLAQFVDKNNREASYQMSLNSDCTVDSLCDFGDRIKELYDVEEHFGEGPVEAALNVIKDNFKMLSEKTYEMVNAEESYYEFSNYQYVMHNMNKVLPKINSPEFAKRIMDELNGAGYEFEDNDGNTPSFHFNTDFYYIDDCPDGVPRYATNMSIRVDYTIEEMDENDNMIPVGVDYYGKEHSFFTEEERDIIGRGMAIRDRRFSDLEGRGMIFKEHDKDSYDLIGLYNGLVMGVYGNIVKMNKYDDTSYVNAADGKIVFTFNKKSGLSELSFNFIDRSYNILYIGKADCGGAKILFEISCDDGTVRRVNRTFVHNHYGFREVKEQD